VGLFTADAYNENPRDIPLLRSKVEALMRRSALDPHSHRGRTLRNILDTLPRDDLFQASLDELERISYGILRLEERRKVRLFCRLETFGRFYSCFVYVPRDRYHTQARHRIEAILRERFDAASLDTQITLSESALARLVATVWLKPGSGEPDFAAIEQEIEEAVRSWADRFRATLLERLPDV